jgi:hypothetical protein
MDDKFCTVLDKLDSKAVLFVTKNCLSTVVGNPQRKVTVFVPAKGFTDTDHFKAHVCGGAWDMQKLQEYAETDSPFLVSKGGAADGKRFKYPVVKGAKITVGGVKLKKEPIVARNGVIYMLDANDELVGEVDDREFVPRERKPRRGSKKAEQEGGRPILDNMAIFKDLIGYELRERIISAYMSLYPLATYPIGGSGLGGSTISWPNVLWSDFCNYVVSTPTLGFGYLQGLAPLVSADYWSNVQMVFQPNETDLLSYGVSDDILRAFALSSFFGYSDPIASINTAFDFHSRLGFVVTRGGSSGGNVVFGGVGVLTALTLGRRESYDVESGFGKIEESLKDYTTFPTKIIMEGSEDPYIKYIIWCVVDAVYGKVQGFDTTDKKDKYSSNEVYLGSHKNQEKYNELMDKYSTSEKEAKDNHPINLLDLCKKSEDPIDRYATLLMVMSVSRYLNRDKKNDKFKCLPFYPQCTGYSSSLGQDTFRGIVGSENFKLEKEHIYTDFNKPQKNYIVTDIFIDTSFVFAPFAGLIPQFNTYYLLTAEHRNCFTMCLMKIFIEAWKAQCRTDEIFTHPKFYSICKEDSAIYASYYPFAFFPILFRFGDTNKYGIRRDEYFSRYIPRQFYEKFSKHCWDQMGTINSGDNVLNEITNIFTGFIQIIKNDYDAYKGKNSVKSDSPMWYLRISDDIHKESFSSDMMIRLINKHNLAHCLYRPTNVLDYLHNNGFTEMVNAIRTFEGSSALPAIGSIRHDHSPGFYYEPQAYNNVVTGARATFNQMFHSSLNNTVAGGAEKVLEIYDAAHANDSMFFANSYMAIRPFHPKVSTTMFYSDFMKFVGAKQVGGNSYAVMTDIYKNMFPGNIAMAVKNLTNPSVYPDLDFGVIDAFVRSEYFLFNAGNTMFRAPRSLADTTNPSDNITRNLLS